MLPTNPTKQTGPTRLGADVTPEGALTSRAYGDVYFSRADGRAETEAVFVAGNGLPERLERDPSSCGATQAEASRVEEDNPFVIGELGFGTGLTFACLLGAWRKAQPTRRRALHMVSFEWDALPRASMLTALEPWPDLAQIMAPVLAAWPETRGPDGSRFVWRDHVDAQPQGQETVKLEVIWGDARQTVPDWEGSADAWCLDGFSPSCNPELWEAGLLQAVYDQTRPGGTFSTYSAAGHVRRNLAAAGFEVMRVPGFGHKRERLVGYRPEV